MATLAAQVSRLSDSHFTSSTGRRYVHTRKENVLIFHIKHNLLRLARNIKFARLLKGRKLRLRICIKFDLNHDE